MRAITNRNFQVVTAGKALQHQLASLASGIICTLLLTNPALAADSPATQMEPAGPFNGGAPGFDDAVANSLTGFSGTQGGAGWQYGYWQPAKEPSNGEPPTGFRRFERYEGGAWRGAQSPAPAISAMAFETASGLVPVRRWTPREKGSVRLVGYLQKPSAETAAEFRVLLDGKEIWSRRLDRNDIIPHAFDILALDLTATSAVDLMVIPGDPSPRVSVTALLQIVSEPYATRWNPELPTGFPETSDSARLAQRKRGQEMLERIREASAARRKQVVIPPGDYRFHADWSRDSTLSDLADLEIIAHGATFWFEPPHVHALLFENCRNVTLRGLTIDFTTPIWSQARITAIDRTSNTVSSTLMSGYEPRDANGKAETAGARTFMFYDAAGRFILHQHIRGDWRRVDDGITVVSQPNRIPDALKPGDYIVSTIRTGAALRSVNCSSMVFEDVNVWSSPGMAVFEGGGGGGHVYRRVRATRRPHTNRLHAFGADVFHLAGADRGPQLDRCESAFGADDNLNIHGRFGRIIKQFDERRYYMEGAYAAGDSLEFRDHLTIELLGIAKVVAVEKVSDGPSLAVSDQVKASAGFLVELDQSLILPEKSLIVMDGKGSARGFVIRNCWFHSNFQRTLINGAPAGRIENTTLQNVGHGLCIQFETWGPWMEGPFARDLVIRNNRFLNSPPAGPLISVSMHPPGGGTDRRPRSAMPVTNMTLTGNYFGTTQGLPISIHNVDGLKIRSNSFDIIPRTPPASATSPAWLYLQNVGNASIDGNYQH